jgi:cathepsin D
VNFILVEGFFKISGNFQSPRKVSEKKKKKKKEEKKLSLFKKIPMVTVAAALLAVLPAAALGAAAPLRMPITRMPMSDTDVAARIAARAAAADPRTPAPRSGKFAELSCDRGAASPYAAHAAWTAACETHASRTAEYLSSAGAALLPARGGRLPIAHMKDYDNELWVANVNVATPQQPSARGAFAVILDTGSSNFWLPSASCNDTGCQGKQKYDATVSTTAHAESKRPWAIPYGTGFAAGTFVGDNVNLAGLQLTNVSFGQADIVAAFFENTPIDGILGLAFEDIAVGHEKPVFDYAWEQGVLAKREFSIYMSTASMSTTSEVVFGGTDPAHYTGEFRYADVLLPSYWLVGMESISVKGAVAHKCGLRYCLCVIDSGTTGIVMPPYAGDPLLKEIGPVAADCSNVASLPTVSFKIGGHDLPMGPDTYVLKETFSNGTSVCQMGIQSMWLTSPLYILGTAFIQAQYAVFDKSTIIPRVGFATSAK